jgi:hypothetical protein
MLGSTTQRIGSLPNPASRRSASVRYVRFQGNPAATAAQEAVIAHLGLAKAIQKLFTAKLFKSDVRFGGLSLEDIASRVQTIVGVYLLQGYFSVKDQKHPWETNGRNVLVWILGILVPLLSKHPTIGVNPVLDKLFMKKRNENPSNWFSAQLNKLRMPIDYKQILEGAGIEKPKEGDWAKMDANKLHRIRMFKEELENRAKGLGAPLNAEEQKLLEHMPGLLRRLNVFPLVSTAIITAATVYIIGVLAMKAVYKFIAPLDKDFNPNGVNRPKPPPGAVPQTSPMAQPSAPFQGAPQAVQQTLIRPPSAFSGFMMNKMPPVAGGPSA